MTRKYLISWHDLGPEPFWAETAAKAKYQAFKALGEAGFCKDFKKFVEGVYVLHLGEEYGDPRTPEYGVAA